MTIPPANNDHLRWQEMYRPIDSQWQDLKRSGELLFTVVLLILFATVYPFIRYVSIPFKEWTPDIFVQDTSNLLLLGRFLFLLLPLLATVIALQFIFTQAATFVSSMYQPSEDEKVAPLIRRKLFGMPPFPPPLNTIFTYPTVVVKETGLEESHWSRWFGGPAILVIYDGVALYLERDSKFSRIVGPGLPMPLLERDERIREVVDLMPQTKEDVVRPWTKDGIRIRLTIRAEFQIASSAEALERSSKFTYPFDPLAIKSAVEYTAVRFREDKLEERSWLEGAWGGITGAVNAFVAGHSLDELFLAPQLENNLSSHHPNNDTLEDIEQLLSERISKQVTNKIQKNLQNNGIQILNFQIIHIEVPEKVRELRTKYWESLKQKVSAQRNSRAEAERIRSREHAHAEAQRIMLTTITKKLENIHPDNLTEPLILSLSGILDQGLDDPLIRPLIAKESFAVLERMRKLLSEHF